MTPASTPLDLAALRKIAEGATEGPWRIYTVTDSGGRSAAVETAWAHDEQGEDTELVTDWCAPEDAAHIVAFDPPTVLALIARTDTAEAAVARIRARHQPVRRERHPYREYCAVCFTNGGMDGALPVLYPCPEIQALEGDNE